MRAVVMIDMQNDFITGPLGTPEAEKALANVVAGLTDFADKNTMLFYTMDTHTQEERYRDSLEGRNLPVFHCDPRTKGWNLPDALVREVSGSYDQWAGIQSARKAGFGSTDLAPMIEYEASWMHEEVDEIIIFGICTDICVLANAVPLRAEFPNTPIKIIANWCAGTTVEAHECALKAMKGLNMELVWKE